MRDEKCCLSYWFPKLQATGVPVPQTHIIQLEKGIWFADCEDDDGASPECKAMFDQVPQLCSDIAACADSLGGYPIFLRSGQTSGKHSWRHTCFVPSKEMIEKHVYGIWEFSEMVDICGLPTHVWAVREMLKVESPFTAFSGFPVTKERRYFFKNGEVVGHHGYWPPEAIEDNTDDPDWMSKLHVLNFETNNEIAELTALTKTVARAFDGAWSLDWLWTTDRGWVAIDMAEAHRSFIWREHPTAPKCVFEGDQI